MDRSPDPVTGPALPDLTPLRRALGARPRRGGAPAGHPARAAAVLVLIVPAPEGPALVLTRRPAELRAHAGQIAFPGGTRAPEDVDATACALREAEEELGIAPAAVTVLGLLDDVLTPTGYLVTPVVAASAQVGPFVPSPAEVAEVFTVPLARLRDPASYRHSGSFHHEGVDYALHEYHHEGRVIWGATARVIHQLLARWPG